MEIGQSTTDGNGTASLAYTPRFSGDTQFVARHGASEAVGTIALGDAGQRFYQPEAGIKLPTAGPKIFIGPDSATHIGPMGQAPTSALYLPGGLTSWLLLVVAAIAMVWFSYFRVIRQIAGIPIKGDIRDTDTRLVPRLALVYVVTLGILLALKLVIGPYSHFNLLH
jgi:hypothetical protein